MIRPGEQLENPVTGEVMIFHETATETDGELVRVETVVRPHGFVAAAHVHPAQTERFTMLEGTVEFHVGGEIVEASAGDDVVVPPGTPHRFRNTGDNDARFVMEIRPARKFESLIETMFTLAAEGKTGKHGLPGPFRLAVIAHEHFDTVQLPFPPPALQRAALAIGAPLGRALGYSRASSADEATTAAGLTADAPSAAGSSARARCRAARRGPPHRAACRAAPCPSRARARP